MQTGSPPDDLHAILGRFHTWAGKNPANGNGHAKGKAEEGVREISYEEALRGHRDRQATGGQRRPTASRTKAAPVAASEAAPAPASSPGEEGAARWIANLPVIPDNEPVIELKAAQAPTGVQATVASPASRSVGPASVPVSRGAARPSAQMKAAIQPPRPATPEQASAAAFSEPPTRAVLDPPSGPRSRPQPRKKAVARQAAAVVAPNADRKSASAAASRSVAKPKRPAIPAKAAVGATQREGQPAPSAMIGSSHPPLSSSTARRAIVRKASSAKAAKPNAGIAKRAAFRQVLTHTVQQPKAALAAGNKPVPDRTRRITTRFSSGEERRIEKCAAALGITVSAYLRQCALAAATPKPLSENAAEAAPPEKTRRAPARGSQPPTQYAPPPKFLFGGWLALLRNRFLGTPVRFSDDA